jgi:hypothetical protein
MSENSYKGNPLIFGANARRQFTLEQAMEYAKCEVDPIYFIEKYVKIITIDHGLQPMRLYEFQKKIVKGFYDNKELIAACGRQLGKCHTKETKYTIRNKKTGEVSEITAEDFHDETKRIQEQFELSMVSKAVRRSLQS